MSATQLHKQWFRLLSQVQDHGLRICILRYGKPVGALVPYQTFPGIGVVIARRGVPVAQLVRARYVD